MKKINMFPAIYSAGIFFPSCFYIFEYSALYLIDFSSDYICAFKVLGHA